MKVDKKDYVLINDNNKRLLVRINHVGEEIRGTVQANNVEDEKPVLFNQNDILVNLGRNPIPGMVLGINVEVLKDSIDDKRFGQIRIYKNLTDKQRSKLFKYIDRFYKVLVKRNLTGVPAHLEIRNPQGKYQGYYKYSPKASADVIAIKPVDSITEEDFLYVISHEYAHGIYNRMYTHRTRSKWIKLYHDHVVLSKITKDTLAEVLKEIETEGSVRAYYKTADEDRKSVIKHCLKYIGTVHGMTKLHLDSLLAVQEPINTYWPTSSIAISDKTICVTDYARKSPEELNSESFAYHFIGKKLPKKVDKILGSSLSRLVRP